ncbi:MAG: signal peptidase I [Clostridia bacterium]|nr:signal peptidase I [Clostridia bacterium]
MEDNKKQGRGRSGRGLTVVGIILCVILIPILILNVIMIIKGFVNPNEVPMIAGRAPLIVLTDSMNPPTGEEFKSIFPIDMTFSDNVKAGLQATTAPITIERTAKERVLSVTIGDQTKTVKKIRSGDLIFVKKIKAEDVKVGDVISFFDPDSSGRAVVTHRVVALEYETSTGKLVSFRTRGDSNNSNDRSSVPVENLVGIWTGTIIGGLGSAAMFLQSTPGLLCCVGLPIILLVGYDVLRRKQSEKAKKQDTDALLAELEELRKKQGIGNKE